MIQNHSRKIKLLHVSLKLGVGGLERLVAELSLRLDKNLFEVSTCSLVDEGHFAEVLRERGIEVNLMRQNPQRFDPRDPWRLSRFFKEQKIDIVHSHSGTLFMCVAAAKLARTPVVVYTDHGRPVVEPRKRIIEESIASRFSDRIVAVSPELKEHLVKVVHFPAKKIDVILNGVNTETFAPRGKPERLMNEFKIGTDTKIVGTIGRLRKIKDQQTLIRAFGIIKDKIPNSRLFLVGDGPLKDELSKLASNIDSQGRIVLAGVRDDIPDWLNLFDVFVLSSLSEGTSVSLLEAMASGTAPVVTAVGGNVSIVDNEITGILVPSQNPQALGEAILDLLEKDEKRSKIAINARSKIMEFYSLDKMVRSYSELYLNILHKKGLYKDQSISRSQT